MRFGCCGSMLSSQPDKTGVEFVEQVAKAGFDYMELPLAEMMALSDEDFDRLKERVASSGISCESCNNFFPASIPLTGPNVDLKVVEDYIHRALGRAAELGVSTVVFGSGGARRVPEGFSMDEAFNQLVQVCHLISPIAQSHNITIAIEPIRPQECNIVFSFADGVALAKAADRPNIRVLVDNFHMAWGNETTEGLDTYGREYLQHVHFANPLMDTAGDRSYPQSMDEYADHATFLAALRNCGYDGRVSIEATCDDFGAYGSGTAKMLKENFG